MEISALYQFYIKSYKVTTDSRNIPKDSLFFALKGDNFNGNLYALEAIEKGASIAIVDEKEFANEDKNIFYFDNALSTLQDLAKHHRNQLKIPVIGLTGSNGKTTTKELIAAVLQEKFKTIYTQGNLNNHIGVPLTILSILPEHEIAVVEMGANHQKEIELLSDISKPDLGYITNFGKAHLEGFGGVEGVIKGKSELYNYLRSAQKTAIINSDDPIQIEKSQGINSYQFSQLDKKANVLYQFKETHHNYCSVEFENTIINSNLTGAYNQYNLGAAIAIGKYFSIEIQKIKHGIENYFPSNSRSQIIEKEGHTILLDAYNANPSSMTVSIQNFAQFSGSKTVIIGDMFELGEYSHEEHQKIVDFLAENKFEKIFLIGKEFSFCKTNLPNVYSFKTTDEFIQYLDENNISTDNILIKGSRGMQLEKTLNHIS